MNRAGLATRRWLAPEVVQTSAMDCGPAALKSLLDGFGAPVSYGRLREACQTDVDGTSIDTIETVAGQLGLAAEQVMIPADHMTLASADALPAIAVVRHAEMATHFVVVWRRIGPWLQVMDPSRGRRWVPLWQFEDELFDHVQSVPALDWRAWAATAEFLGPLRERMAALGVRATATDALVSAAIEDATWFPLAALDAAVRLVASMVRAGGIKAGVEAAQLLTTLWSRTRDSGEDIFTLIPSDYWSATPDAGNADPTREMLRIKGVVLLRAAGLRDPRAVAQARADLSPELAAALSERPVSPVASLWQMLSEDGMLAPLALAAAMAFASCILIVEALLFRSVFDMAAFLTLPSQRLGATLALLVFAALLLMIETSVVLEALRLGRRLEARFRMALLRKLPRLNDRYFQSRPVTDMADRSHNIHLLRNVPSMGLQFVQTLMELALTLFGVAMIDPSNAWLAVALVVAAMVIPFGIQPMLNERDLRVRTHAAASHGFYLDALLGLAPIRAHGAERSVRRQHESLLVEWARSLAGSIRMTLVSDAAQGILCSSLAGGLLIAHFLRQGQVNGSDLLLTFWALKLPAIGARVAGLAHQYPAQRNTLLRQLEPLSAPEEISEGGEHAAIAGPARISIRGGAVVASGHVILEDLDIDIAPGEHVAIVGVSGAGKSSLLGLLLGWHRLASGRLLIDGEPATRAGLELLRRSCAWVDPSVQIWNRTLLENLEYATDAPAFDRVGEVLEAARLRSVTEKLPRGLQSMLGEGGGLLSGGEGQRVRLGRAFFMPDARLALLDEPFRGLDRAQRRALLAESRAWWRAATLICVTHDVGETLDFARVLVVEHGRIVEDGAPAALAARASRYRALLDAEAQVRDALWADERWRRVRMEQGRLVPAEADA